MEVQGKVTIITGASAGIGQATAQRFAQAGAKVVLAARSTDRLERLAEELRQQGHEAVALPTDMRKLPEVERMVAETVKRFGQIDILINNAGQAAAGTVSNVNIDHYRQILDLNVFGPLYAIQAVAPLMRQSGGGLIINISSMVSKMHIPGLGAYASTKAALNMLSDTAREELGPDNIRVITMYPRITTTEFGKNSLGDQRMRQGQRVNPHSGFTADTPEMVAEKILQAAFNEPAEQYMET